MRYLKMFMILFGMLVAVGCGVCGVYLGMHAPNSSEPEGGFFFALVGILFSYFLGLVMWRAIRSWRESSKR